MRSLGVIRSDRAIERCRVTVDWGRSLSRARATGTLFYIFTFEGVNSNYFPAASICGHFRSPHKNILQAKWPTKFSYVVSVNVRSDWYQFS